MINIWIALVIGLVGIIIGGVVLIIRRYRKDLKALRLRITQLNSQILQTECGPIEYLQVGAGSPLLVIHGAMGGVDQGLWLANGYKVAHYQLIIPSRFGYLGTPVPDNADLNLQADAFAQLLDGLNIKKVAVFAISSGTTSAIRFTSRYPERVSGLILLSPDSPGEVQMSLPPRSFFELFFGNDFIHWAMVSFGGKWMQEMFGLAPRGYKLTPEYYALLKKVMLGDLPVSQRSEGMIFETYTILDEFKALVSPNNPFPLSKLEIPVLVINAEDDPISIAENVTALANQFPRLRRYVAHEGGHLLFGHAEEVKSEIAQFLRDNLPE